MANQYVWSPVYVDALVERHTSTQNMYVEQDANFNVVALVDTSGNVQERYIYDPYASVTILASNWTTRGTSNYGWVFFFQGKRIDFATGLYASRERDYSPTLGRWMENDPLGIGGGDSNLYRSDGNDPTTLCDPFGLHEGVKPKPYNPNSPGGQSWSGWPTWFTYRPSGPPLYSYTRPTSPHPSVSA